MCTPQMYGPPPLAQRPRRPHPVVRELVILSIEDETDSALQVVDAVKEGDLAQARKAVSRVKEIPASSVLIAAGIGNADILKCLIANGGDVNCEREGETPLIATSRRGHVKCVHLLLREGANKDARNRELGETALMCALKNFEIQCFEILLEAGADPNIPTEFLSTTYQGLAYIVDGLFRPAVDVAAQDKHNGKTALMQVATSGLMNCFYQLLDAGADPHAKDSLGRTTLHWAAEYRRAEMVEVLIDCGVNVNARAQDNGTALMEAAQSGKFECVALLLAAGASVGIEKKITKHTALTLAAGKRSPLMIKALIEGGANVNHKVGYKGKTALMYAAQNYDVESVRLLLRAGADVNAITRRGFTALAYVARIHAKHERADSLEARQQRVTTAKLLIGHGATACFLNIKPVPLNKKIISLYDAHWCPAFKRVLLKAGYVGISYVAVLPDGNDNDGEEEDDNDDGESKLKEEKKPEGKSCASLLNLCLSLVKEKMVVAAGQNTNVFDMVPQLEIPKTLQRELANDDCLKVPEN